MIRPWWLHPGLGVLALLILAVGIINVLVGVADPERLGSREFIVMHVLAIVASGYLLIGWLLPFFVGREQPDTMQRVAQAQASGPMLAAAWCGARVGLVSFRGRLLRVSVYPGGIVIQPLLVSARAILASELLSVDAVPPIMGWFGPASLQIRHTAPDVRASVRFHVRPDSQLATAIRALRPD